MSATMLLISRINSCNKKLLYSSIITKYSGIIHSSTNTTNYFEKNEKLKRPMSPYVQYKPQITSVLSITHRLTGLGLATLLYTGGIAALGSSSTNFAQVLDSITGVVPHWMIFTVKVLAGTSLVYHAVNGVRHLAWDMGYGFSLKELYTSGYVVIAITTIALVALIASQ